MSANEFETMMTPIEPVPPLRLVREWYQLAEHPDQPEQAAAVFRLCAAQLGLWIQHEGNHVALCMPPSVMRMMAEAIHFDEGQEDSWQALGLAAKAMRTGTV